MATITENMDRNMLLREGNTYKISTDIYKDKSGEYKGNMKLDALVESGKDIIFEDDADPYNIVVSLPATIVPIYEELPDDIKNMDEVDLRKMIKPTLRDYMIKKSFWMEWVQSMTEGRRMIIRNIVGGFSGVINHFGDKCSRNPKLLAWLCKPEYEYMAYLEAVGQRAREQLWTILDQEIVDEKGNMDIKKAKLVFDVGKYVMDRQKGEPIKRIDKRVVTMNYDEDPVNEYERVEQKIKEIEVMTQATKEQLESYEPQFKEMPKVD